MDIVVNPAEEAVGSITVRKLKKKILGEFVKVKLIWKKNVTLNLVQVNDAKITLNVFTTFASIHSPKVFIHYLFIFLSRL